MGLYDSPYDYVIHKALIATSRITSFQSPLVNYNYQELLSSKLSN